MESFIKKYTFCQMYGGYYMLYCKLGVYYDLIYVLTEYFNNGIKNKWLDLKCVPNSIRPFFYKGDKGYSFMQNILNESYEELLLNDSIVVIQNKLIDCEITVNKIIDFYFGEGTINFLFNDYKFVCDINKEIAKSEYPDNLKSLLYSLFIEPVKTVHDLMRTLLELHSQLAQMYKNRILSISKKQQDINDDELLTKLNIPKVTSENTVCAVCLLDSECVKVVNMKNNRFLLLLGEDYHKTFEIDNELDLKEFGYVLTEINRLKLLNMMHLNGEITIKDIEQELRFSGTNAYYHLSLMTKSGMVTTRYEGRTVFYSLNKSYFRTLCLKLWKYYE